MVRPTAMQEILFAVLLLLGLAVAVWPAMEAIRRRTAVWCALSVLLPCLYALVGLFILGLIDGRGLNVPLVALSGVSFSALGWLNAWNGRNEQQRAKLAQLDEIEERVINDQSYIDEWQEMVTQMERDGNSVNEPRAFLEGLRQSKADYLAHRDRILMELEQDGVRSLSRVRG
jgi:hypothetical protein